MDRSPWDCFDLLSDLMIFDTAGSLRCLLIGSGHGFGKPEATLEANLSSQKHR